MFVLFFIRVSFNSVYIRYSRGQDVISSSSMGTVSIKSRLASLVVCAIITLDNCPVRASDDLNRVRKNNRTPQHHNHHTNHDNHDHSKHGEHTTDVIFIGKQFGEESGRKV